MYLFIQYFSFLADYLLYLFFLLTVPSSSGLGNTPFSYSTDVFSFKTKDKYTDNIELILFVSLKSEALAQKNLTLAGFISTRISAAVSKRSMRS